MALGGLRGHLKEYFEVFLGVFRWPLMVDIGVSVWPKIVIRGLE